MELRDSAFPLVHDIVGTDDPNIAFKDADAIFLVGSRPRTKDMDRSDLVAANGPIFVGQGKAIDAVASPNVKVVTVGNPCNTNALIAASNAPDINPRSFTAMMRLDHNRAIAQLAKKTGIHNSEINKVAIWGNHSTTQYPDITNALIDSKKAIDILDQKWVRNEFIPRVQKRGAEIIQARGLSSAASAASAAIDHMRDWELGSSEDDWVSMAVPSDGSYGISEGIIFSYPITCKDQEYSIVQGLDLDEFSLESIKTSEQELLEEREAIKHLL